MQMHAAVARQPVSVAIGTKGAKGWQHYKGGVFDGFCPERIDHAVVAVGYGTLSVDGSDESKDFWLVKNSWGPRWGDGGYIRMARTKEDGPGICGIQKAPSYPLKTSPNPTPRHDYVPSGANTFSCMLGAHACCSTCSACLILLCLILL